jgi:hypothetical protein
LKETFLSFRIAVLDGVDDVATEPVEVRLSDGGLSLGFEKRGQLVPSGLEGSDLPSEGLDALPAGGLRQSAGLEGEEVPLDGFFGFGQLGLDHAELVLVLSARGPGTCEASSERSVEQVVSANGA